MLTTMFVSLYTSRVVLKALGVDDFGLYQTVGGIVVMLSFLNGALSTGSSRFLTFELGKGVTQKLKETFSTLLFAHIIIALLVVVIGAPLGIWFISNHLVVPPEKLTSAYVIFHLSIFTSFLSITQVPYSSIIIAHENLSIYAYISIGETLLRFCVAFFIQYIHNYKLELYAFLLSTVQIISILFYRFFCVCYYVESRFNYKLINFSVLKDIGIFSGWSLFAAVSIPLTNQGTLILLNNYFSSAVVSARSVALQVNNAVNQFITNFRTASNPQIVKRYSSGDFDGSKRLLLVSTSFSFYLMLLLALPVYILAEPLLRLWLVEVPQYSVFFLKWSMISSLFSVFDVSFYTALYSKGRLRENALLSPVISALQFPILYFYFRKGLSPHIVAYINVVVMFIIGCVVKPVLICKFCSYRFREIYIILLRCLIVTGIAIPLPFFLANHINYFVVQGFLSVCVVCVLCTGISVFLVGLNKEMRQIIFSLLTKKSMQ